MSKLVAVRVKRQLAEQVEERVQKGEYTSLSEFVSEAIQLRLRMILENRIKELLERPLITGTRAYTCTNHYSHNIKVIKYDDGSIWVMCPMFGWFEDNGSGMQKLGCKERKKRCTWFVGQ